MFLLNEIRRKIFTMLYRFTIQNVPIKLKNLKIEFQQVEHLQYKMFLLNYKFVYLKIEKIKYLQYKMFLLNLIFLKLPIQYTTFPHFCRYQYFHIFLSRISFYLFIKQSKNPVKIDITKNLSVFRLFGVIPGRQILFKRSLKFYYLRFPKILFLVIFLGLI